MTNKLRFLITGAIVAMVTVGWIANPGVQELDLVGTWLVTSDDESHQRGALIFNDASYSMMLVNGDEPRAQWGDQAPTDADMLAAFRSITANSGRYTLEGDQLTWEAYMANNPNYMAGWPDNDATTTVSIDDGILTATFFNRTLKFRRVEDS